jgi:hypothetical protein
LQNGARDIDPRAPRGSRGRRRAAAKSFLAAYFDLSLIGTQLRNAPIINLTGDLQTLSAWKNRIALRLSGPS